MKNLKNVTKTETIVYDPDENILLVLVNQFYPIPEGWALMANGKTYQYDYTIDEIKDGALERGIYLKETELK
jgi:hypothetical protein